MAGKSLGVGVGVDSVASKWDVVIDSMLKCGDSLQESGTIGGKVQGAKA